MKKIHSKTSLLLIFPAIAVMLIIWAMHYTDAWGPFAFWEGLFGWGGYILVQLRLGQSLNPASIPLAKFQQGDAFWHTAFEYLAIMLLQIFLGMFAYKITVFEQAAYRVFAGPCEEMLWRAGIIILICGTAKNPSTFRKVLSVGIESVGFMLIHTQYYGDWNALLTVFLAGMIWGIFFVMWWDLGANMVSHFLVNATAFFQWYLVTFTAMPFIPAMILPVMPIAVLFYFQIGGRGKNWF